MQDFYVDILLFRRSEVGLSINLDELLISLLSSFDIKTIKYDVSDLNEVMFYVESNDVNLSISKDMRRISITAFCRSASSVLSVTKDSLSDDDILISIPPYEDIRDLTKMNIDEIICAMIVMSAL